MRVLVGPIIGKVTSQTAVVLLEVDRATEVTCFVSLVDAACPNGKLRKLSIAYTVYIRYSSMHLFHLEGEFGITLCDC